MTSHIKITFQREASVVPTLIVEGLHSYNSFSPSLILNGVNLEMINCNASHYLRLGVKNATRVIVENCTFGDWVFKQVLQMSIKDCIAPKSGFRLTLDNTSGLIENITLKDSHLGFQLHVNNYIYIQITKSKFANNLVDTALIIVSDSSTLEMLNCIVQNNQLINSTENHDSKNEGLVLLSNSSMLISQNSTFDTNTGVGTMLVYKSKAIFLNCLFSGNINSNGAGILFSKYSSLLIDGTSFEKNIVSKFDTFNIPCTLTLGGGVIFAKNFSQTTVCKTIFRANTGPSIRFINNGSLQIDSCDFVDNSACFGGAVAGSHSMVNISDTKFSHNNATMGAALYVDKCDVFLHNCSSTDNFASLRGGAIMISHSSVQMFSNIFSRNIATNGGAFAGSGKFSAKQCLMRDNTAKAQGGVAYFGEHSEIYIITSIFRENLALSSGGVFRFRNGFVSIKNSSFEHNSAELNGGVIFVEDSCVINISQVICSRNKVKLGVGGVLNAKGQTKVYVADTKVQQNSARFCGAMFIGSGSVLTLSHSKIEQNYAIEHFGALCIHSTSVLVASNSYFKENNGSTGASLTVMGSAAYLENCTLTQNKENKEAIMVSSATELRLSRTTVFQTAQQYVIHTGKVYTYRCLIRYGNKTLKSDNANFKQFVFKDPSISSTSAIAESP